MRAAHLCHAAGQPYRYSKIGEIIGLSPQYVQAWMVACRAVGLASFDEDRAELDTIAITGVADPVVELLPEAIVSKTGLMFDRGLGERWTEIIGALEVSFTEPGEEAIPQRPDPNDADEATQPRED